jgi:hypothetical protein
LLLDGSAASQAVVAPEDGQSHVQAASRILGMLDAIGVTDPPPDLVARTMRRIDSAIAMPGENQAQAPYVNRHHPLM